MRHIIYNILLMSLALTAVQVNAQSIDPTITYRDGSGEEGSLAAGDTYNGPYRCRNPQHLQQEQRLHGRIRFRFLGLHLQGRDYR